MKMKKCKKVLLLLTVTILLGMAGIIPEGIKVQAASAAFELCYGDQLSGTSRQIYDAMVSEWVSGGTGNITVKFSSPYTFRAAKEDWDRDRESCDEYNKAVTAIRKAVQGAYDAFIYDYPQVFWLADIKYYNGMNFTASGTQVKGKISSLVLHGNEKYTGAKTEVAEFQSSVAQTAAAIQTSVSSGSRVAILRAIHDYLCNELIYGSTGTGETARTAAGVFLKNRVVLCEGYAKAFKILCDKFDIPCVLVIGNANGIHMWNYVRMKDGRWYLVDVTWDDREDEVLDTYFLAGKNSVGLSGNTIAEEHTAYTDVSGTGAKSFVLPKLTAQTYSNEHHIWAEISRKKATCLAYGKVVYQCGICGVRKTELLKKTGHSWGTYRSNKDATCLKDGTKTAKCSYGCGARRTVTDKGSKLKPTLKLNVTGLVMQNGQIVKKVKVSGLGKGDSVVSWKSSKKSVVKTEKKGKLGVVLTAGKTGKATVTVTLKSGLKKSFQVVVQRKKVATQKITGVPASLKLKKGKSITLSPVRSPVNSQEKVKFSSSSSKIASVSDKGVVTGKEKGTAVITVISGMIRKKCKIQIY